VQVASFRGDAGAVARAQVEYERRHRQPIEIVSAQVNDRLWHRVCVGRYPTFEEAERALAKLEAEGKIGAGLVRRLTGATLASD
jgi:hypothetical protein